MLVANFGAEHMITTACTGEFERSALAALRKLAALLRPFAAAATKGKPPAPAVAEDAEAAAREAPRSARPPPLARVVLATPSCVLGRRNAGMSTARGAAFEPALRRIAAQMPALMHHGDDPAGTPTSSRHHASRVARTNDGSRREPSRRHFPC